MKTNCVFCGEEISTDANYCSACGMTQTDNIEGEISPQICHVCGAENPSDSKQCYICCSIFSDK